MARDAHGTPIGIVGLGLVGNAIARRLEAAGFRTLGFDVREEARASFADAGGGVAASIAEVGAAAGTVILAVFETRDVIEVVEGPDGLLSRGDVRTLVDCSTGAPSLLEALAARLAARGVVFIEAPLSGSSQQIAAGEATVLLGGADDAIARCTPLLDALSRRRIHVGGPGMGARAKLATNLVLGLNRAALAEGMVFAETLGIAPATFLSLVLATPAHSVAAETKGRMMVEGDFAPQSRIRQHLKDVDLMLDGARGAGQRLPLSETHAALMRAAIAAGDGDLDNAAILRQLRRETLPPSPSPPNED
ncbi:2-(hydroxymethyl)glutarate dehydrogenase [Variovorax sp. SRS16]|uniref:NAD(P)-dependent oxidoreductase n=1 Tax=Variovorax sp. SRS16 TaxID=282217 RepID=UPI0013170340|nr:NAD(P)-dependent oxidoreductase [Variovorax sp. SRS16]VTU16390.1 2-(hydroxymethyl)glutarate dehydrogenase [Variovorax sp. SRS16]